MLCKRHTSEDFYHAGIFAKFIRAEEVIMQTETRKPAWQTFLKSIYLNFSDIYIHCSKTQHKRSTLISITMYIQLKFPITAINKRSKIPKRQ